MRRIVVASSIIIFSILSFPAIAFAPQMIENEITSQRSLGYEPCEPEILQLPIDEALDGKIADAGGTLPGETCSIRFAHNIAIQDLEWVPWHEVCHLSTLNEIYSDPHMPIIDPAHEHAAFQWCIAQGPENTGNYLRIN